MQSQMANLSTSLILIKTINPNSLKSISTSSFLNQQPQFDEQPQSLSPSPLPPNPSYGSHMYHQTRRTHAVGQTLTPLHHQNPSFIPPVVRDVDSLMNLFGGWVTSQRWGDIKEVFEQWINSLDVNENPSRSNVEVFN
ncbi:hypothetical protein RND81_09G113400 [Saponaria officinalis]|uniref:Uncharacterized protein n=1 Tax=Saponaria officinalis TaxID=3572 RepID=A0AAW1ILF1_SAPOF